MFDGYDAGRRLEPADALDTEQVRLGRTLSFVEVSRNSHGRMRQYRGINAGCLGAGLNGRQQRQRQRVAGLPAHKEDRLLPSHMRGTESETRQERSAVYPEKFTDIRFFMAQSHFLATQS